MADVGSFLNILQCYITTVLRVLFALYHKLICFSRFPNRLLVRFHVPPCIQLFAFVIFGSRAYVNRVITKPPVHTMPENATIFFRTQYAG